MANNEITIVLADDHPLVSHGLCCELEKDSRLRVVVQAADGEQALQAVRQFKPDIVILDIDMPGVDGFQVATQMRKEALPGKLVFLSVHSETSFVKKALRLGAAGYILKESALADVLAGIHTICAGETYFSPGVLPQVSHRAPVEPLAEPPTETLALALLTPTEHAVLGMIAECCSTREIAERLGVSPRTVETHRANICKKLSLRGNHALTKYALAHFSEL